MNLFLDTSSLIKLYNKETDTIETENIIIKNKVRAIYLSELTQIEFISAIWKKIRTKELDKKAGLEAIKFFESDIEKYNWIKIDSEIIKSAKNLLIKYGNDSLRSLDAIQLACAIKLKHLLNLYKSSDKILEVLFVKEGLKIR